MVVPVRPPFSLSPARLALWAGVSLAALAVFGGVVLWLAWRNYRAVCPNCGIGVSPGALVTFSGVALWLALGFILWRNCKAVCPRTTVMVPWAGTSAGPGSPSSCGPAWLPVSWPPSGGRSTWRCCRPGCSSGRCSAEVRVTGLSFGRPWSGSTTIRFFCCLWRMLTPQPRPQRQEHPCDGPENPCCWGRHSYGYPDEDGWHREPEDSLYGDASPSGRHKHAENHLFFG